MSRPSTIERAYELARSGSCRSVDDIHRRLKDERHEAIDGHLHGSGTRKALRSLCEEACARTATAPTGDEHGG